MSCLLVVAVFSSSMAFVEHIHVLYIMDTFIARILKKKNMSTRIFFVVSAFITFYFKE